MLSNNLRKHSLQNRLHRWQRTFNTIRHLQPRQAWYFFLRRGIGARRVKLSPGDVSRRKVVIHPVLQLTHADGDFSAYAFSFLNHSLSFPRDAMNWCPQEAQRLWRYNLHYFDFLRDPTRPLRQKTGLIDDWIANNPQGSEPAWEAYTVSLRIVNWCLFFWSLPANEIRKEWLHSLYDQTRWLDRNLERHILANHYFENIKAMLFAALFFDNSNSARWFEHFQGELIEQLHEQVLSDGGHYERSPQYHCILLEDFLDLYALLNAQPSLTRAETLTELKQTIESTLQFLSVIATPDDDIPLFNDSASGAASRPSAIFAKAQALRFTATIRSSALIDLPVSGLFGWKSGSDYFLIDCGDIGPDYQPGHTHCDFLSFVLMLHGQWLIVDSGVCEYEPGAMRNYVRSTAAHNTVVVDDNEQSEIWGEFRVGRRARSIGASIRREGNLITFEGAYSGFPSVAANIVHSRRVVLTLDSENTIHCLNVYDKIDGSGERLRDVKTLLHLHPELIIESTDGAIADEDYIFIKKDHITLATLSSPHQLTIAPAPSSWFCPEFGRKLPNSVLKLQARSKLPAYFSYQLAVNRSN